MEVHTERRHHETHIPEEQGPVSPREYSSFLGPYTFY